MHHLKIFIAILLAVGVGATLVLPTPKAQATGVSFGGRIIAFLPCMSALGPSIWVTLLPAGPLLPPYMYIYTPATLNSLAPPSPAIPPSHPGQEIMGRFDSPYMCVFPSIPPLLLYGLRMQTETPSPM